MIRRVASRIALTILVGMVLLVHGLHKLLFFRRLPLEKPCRVLMIGTFESPGWLQAHAGPLSACKAVSEVGIVCTAPFDINLPKIRFYCPSQRAINIFGRRLARIIILLKVAVTVRPSVYIGYHLMPNSFYALLLARIFGGRAIYQMTGGPIQIIGGGYQSENPLLAATGSPCRFMEYILFSLVRCFDIIIVRGKKAESFVRQHHLAKQCFIITGAIDTDKFVPTAIGRDYDILYVGRLVKNKRVDQCVQVASELARLRPGLQFAIVGDGPLKEEIRSIVRRNALENNVTFFGQLDDVINILQRGKIFLLLSASEGLSIAMIEAMACGLPVVVTRVGDLGDVFVKRLVGLLIDEVDPSEIAMQINSVLHDGQLLDKLSCNARKTIVEEFSIEAVAKRWQKIFSIL